MIVKDHTHMSIIVNQDPRPIRDYWSFGDWTPHTKSKDVRFGETGNRRHTQITQDHRIPKDRKSPKPAVDYPLTKLDESHDGFIYFF